MGKRNTKNKRVGSNKLPYGNYKVYHPDGHLMFFCDLKKYRWYLKKTDDDGNPLAKEIGEKEIQLLFEPGGGGEDPKFLTARENRCVVTGDTEDLTKHHVVPTQYRQHFPMKYKSKNSSDVVTITREEHNKYERIADTLKFQLELEHTVERERDFNKTLSYTKKLLNTIKNYRNEIPDNRLNDLYKEINNELDRIDIAIDHLEKIKPFDLNQIIVERVGIEELIKIWKNHFVEYANPQYLPEWWDPNHIKIVLNAKF